MRAVVTRCIFTQTKTALSFSTQWVSGLPCGISMLGPWCRWLHTGGDGSGCGTCCRHSHRHVSTVQGECQLSHRSVHHPLHLFIKYFTCGRCWATQLYWSLYYSCQPVSRCLRQKRSTVTAWRRRGAREQYWSLYYLCQPVFRCLRQRRSTVTAWRRRGASEQYWSLYYLCQPVFRCLRQRRSTVTAWRRQSSPSSSSPATSPTAGSGCSSASGSTSTSAPTTGSAPACRACWRSWPAAAGPTRPGRRPSAPPTTCTTHSTVEQRHSLWGEAQSLL